VPFYLCFIHNSSMIVAPITDCMKGGRFLWSKEATDVFEVIKVKLTMAPLLVLLDFTQPFELHCDAQRLLVLVQC